MSSSTSQDPLLISHIYKLLATSCDMVLTLILFSLMQLVEGTSLACPYDMVPVFILGYHSDILLIMAMTLLNLELLHKGNY